MFTPGQHTHATTARRTRTPRQHEQHCEVAARIQVHTSLGLAKRSIFNLSASRARVLKSSATGSMRLRTLNSAPSASQQLQVSPRVRATGTLAAGQTQARAGLNKPDAIADKSSMSVNPTCCRRKA